MNNINEVIAEKLGQKLNVKLWSGGANNRLYIKGVGHNTKKMKTNAYIDLNTFKAVVFVECDSQPSAWCKQQAEVVTEGLAVHVRYARMIASSLAEPKSIESVVEEIEVEAHNEELNSQNVVGVYGAWEQLRVAVNRYGKFETRNRLVCYKIECTKATAPKNFVELAQEVYDLMADKSVLEPYTEIQDEINYRIKLAEHRAKQIAQN